MGKFIYGATGTGAEVDDRLLAHLRVAIMTKLRRNESFMLELDAGNGNGRRTFWISPSIPIQFHFYGGRSPRLNRAWAEDMIRIASGAGGLSIPPEPTETKAQTDED